MATAADNSNGTDIKQGNPRADGGADLRSALMRLLFMFIIAFIYGVSRIVVCAVVVVQFLWVVFSHSPNGQLSKFGQSLANYTYEIVRYLTFVTEDRPYPFDLPWPQGEAFGDDSDSNDVPADDRAES